MPDECFEGDQTFQVSQDSPYIEVNALFLQLLYALFLSLGNIHLKNAYCVAIDGWIAKAIGTPEERVWWAGL
jgi:hypothetical protein